MYQFYIFYPLAKEYVSVGLPVNGEDFVQWSHIFDLYEFDYEWKRVY